MSMHLVLSVKPYDFESKRGERIKGAKISYVNMNPSSRDSEVGHPPLIVSTQNSNLVNGFTDVPGIYELNFEQVTGKNNKPEIVLDFVECMAPVELEKLFDI